MAITNMAILLETAAANLDIVFNDYENAVNYIKTHDEVPLHTFAGWKKRGYSVKKGAHHKLETALWKYKDYRKKDEEEVDVSSGGYCFLTKAYLFTIEQVERREK